MPKKKKTVKLVRVCPVCGSTDVVPYLGFTTGIRYRCRKCGYIGVFFPKKKVKK